MKLAAPYLALVALGVATLEVIPPRFYEVPTAETIRTRRTGNAAIKRQAKKNRNRRKHS